MSSNYREFEGTVEEIQAQLSEYEGQRLHVTIIPVEQANNEIPVDAKTPPHAFARFMNAPASERAKVPVDLTDNLDHYIYGLPRK